MAWVWSYNRVGEINRQINRTDLELSVPRVSMRYFCPTSFMYSSMAFVAKVFSLKISASFSPKRWTSAPPSSIKNSCEREEENRNGKHFSLFVAKPQVSNSQQ